MPVALAAAAGIQAASEAMASLMAFRRARNCLLALLLRQWSHSAAPLPGSEMKRLTISHAASALLPQASHAPNDDALRNDAR